MPKQDADKWNRRYSRVVNQTLNHPRQFLLDNARYLPGGGLVLDVAMGLGRNAAWLQTKGFRVIGVDISEVGVSSAKASFPELSVFVGDLQRVFIPEEHFDGIINFYYLQRDLFPKLIAGLKAGGVLIAETLLRDSLTVKPELTPEFLLFPGELLSLCRGLDVLRYREAWIDTRHGKQMAVASIVARRIS